jgi:Protein of unknown function (DUF3352)
VSAPEAGGPGGGEASSETGSKSNDGNVSRFARLRRRLRPGSGQSGAPEPPKEEAPKPHFAAEPLKEETPKPLFSLEPPEEEKKPKRRREMAFRARTRLRAIGYWLREKGQVAQRWLKRTGAGTAAGARSAGGWWTRRSRGTKMRTYAVAGIALLYLVIKFLPVPGVPCEISAANECAPSNQTVAYVPTNAALYAHVTVNSDSHQWELAEDLGDELPNLTALLQSDTRALSVAGSNPINLGEQVLPWAEEDLTLIGVTGPAKSVVQAYIVGVGDAAKADEFLTSASPGGKSKQSRVDGGTLTVYSNGFAAGRFGDQAVFGNVTAVRAALDANSGRVPELTGSEQGSPLEALPEVRLAEVYLSRTGVERLLAGREGGASQLNTFVDYGATTGMAASLRLRDDGVEVHLNSRLDPKLERQSPTVFASLPEFDPELADEAGPRALGYVGIGELGPAINEALATAGAGAQGLAGSLRQLAQSLQQEAGVDPLKDLLPALDGQAALVAEPTDAVPYATLIIDGVDEEKAGEALAALQRPLVRSLSAGGERVASFRTREVDGVAVHSVQISPTVDLSYAIFDGMLVVSTRPEGISQVRSSGDNLAGTNGFEDATDRLPDRVSALVFLNLEEVLGLAQQAGLAENPLYASLSEDISRVGSLGLAVRGSDDELRTELFLAIQD